MHPGFLLFFFFLETYKLDKLHYAGLNEQIKKIILPMLPLMHLRKSQLFFSETCFHKTYKLGKLHYAALNEQIKKLILPMSPLMHLLKSRLFFSETCFHKKTKSTYFPPQTRYYSVEAAPPFATPFVEKNQKGILIFWEFQRSLGFCFSYKEKIESWRDLQAEQGIFCH